MIKVGDTGFIKEHYRRAEGDRFKVAYDHYEDPLCLVTEVRSDGLMVQVAHGGVTKNDYKGWRFYVPHGMFQQGRREPLVIKTDGQDRTQGRKDDSGKLDMTLLDDMPLAVKAVVEVMQWAIVDKKPEPYVRGSWLGVHADRYRAAIMRHMRDAADQARPGKSRASPFSARFQRDKETNLLHLAHVACSAMMALENTLREIEDQQQ